jgi:hypothetical protein
VILSVLAVGRIGRSGNDSDARVPKGREVFGGRGAARGVVRDYSVDFGHGCVALHQVGRYLAFKHLADDGHLVFTGEDSPLANLMLSVMGAFAEFERTLIGERQREGITLAKARGAYRGRKKALSPEQAVELRRRAGTGEQKTGLAREFGINCETLYQYPRTDRQARLPKQGERLLTARKRA